jgi:hypothetical protein
MIHPIAASAILAAGSVLSNMKQNDWKERVDDTMAHWEQMKHGRISRTTRTND